MKHAREVDNRCPICLKRFDDPDAMRAHQKSKGHGIWNPAPLRPALPVKALEAAMRSSNGTPEGVIQALSQAGYRIVPVEDAEDADEADRALKDYRENGGTSLASLKRELNL